jgi:hypothetical protein
MKGQYLFWVVVAVVLGAVAISEFGSRPLLAEADSNTPTPSLTPNAVATPTPSPSITTSPTRTTIPTRTQTPTRTLSPTITSTPTQTLTPTPTRTPFPTLAPGGPTPQVPVWSTPIMISASDQAGWFADIVADRSGTVHVAWSSGISTGLRTIYDVVLYRTTTDGIHWSDARDIAAILTKGAATRPALLVDPTGLLHLAYRSYTIYYSHAPVANVRADKMSPAMELSSPEAGYFSRLAWDSRGRLHAVYTENAYDPSCVGCFHLYYRWSDDQGDTWSKPVDISHGMPGVAKPWLVIDQKDNLHVVCETGRGGDLGQVPEPARVSYLASYDRGSTWSTPVDFVPDPDGEGRNITLGIDGRGRLIAAWLALPQDRVYFKTSTDAGRTWSAPNILGGVWGGWKVYQTKLDTYSMATDSAGNIHLVLVGRTDDDQTSLDVLSYIWNGLAWSGPDVITTLTGDVPEWPRLAIDNRNQLHLVWFVRKEMDIWTNPGTNRLWYAFARTDAPAVPTAPWTTLVPTPGTPEATPSLAPRASSTPLPTLAPVLSPPPGTDQPIYTEADYLLVVGKSLLPAIGFVGLVMLVVRLVRSRR